MGEKLFRLICIVGGGFSGYYTGEWYVKNLLVDAHIESVSTLNMAGIIMAFAMMGYLLSPVFYRELQNFNSWIDISIHKFSPQNIASGASGIIVGLLISNLILLPFFIRGGSYPASIAINSICAYLGLIVCIKLNLFPKLGAKGHEGAPEGHAIAKLLDTSVIIDGRIVDIYKTNFIEGDIVVPNFVFQELRHIADSSDSLRRNRGRRGLDVIAALQELFPNKVKIHEADLDRRIEVDEQLIKVAKETDSMIITNDYNLNKQASLHGITVLNINELANAVKSVVLPGEELEIQLIKEGKEYDQGIGYLKDGTMVVVEDGRRYIGDTISVIITNMLQTPAGRVIFARPKHEGYVRS